MHGPTEFFDVRHFRLAEKMRHARFVVCISDFARSQLMALGDPGDWDKLHVIHVGIPIEQFTPARTSRADPRAEPEILCIGRLVPEKGQALLLQAFARVIEPQGRCGLPSPEMVRSARGWNAWPRRWGSARGSHFPAPSARMSWPHFMNGPRSFACRALPRASRWS